MKRLALLFAAAMILVPVPTQSQEYGWWSNPSGWWTNRMVGYNSDGSPRFARVYCLSDGRCFRPTRHARPYRDPTRVYSYVRRAEEDITCRDTRRVVGDQHLTVDGAKKAANDAWAGAVRFHLGEKFMDLANARHITYTCSRSSIKEGGVTTLGQTLTRCEIEAQPCHAPRVNEASDR